VKTISRWATQTALTERERLEIANILHLDPLDPVVGLAEKAVINARIHCNPPGSSTDLKDLAENFHSLKTALERMKKTLRFMDNAHYLDDHFYLANNSATLLQLSESTRGGPSGFEAMTGQLLAAVKDFESESLEPVGRGRRPDTSRLLKNP